MTTKRWAALILAAVTAMTALTGCSVAQQSASSSRADAESKGTVTILTHDSFALSDEAKAEFESATGYKLVTTASGDASTVLNQILLTADNPTVDGVYGIDNFSVFKLLDAGVLDSDKGAQNHTWTTSGVSTQVDPEANFADPGFAESEHNGAGNVVPIDRGDVCLNIDNQWFAERDIKAPATFIDILKPEYKDLTVVTNPAASSPGYAMLVGTVALFREGWQDYWEMLFDNGVKVDDSWSDAYYTDFTAGNDEGTGTRPIVLSYASSPAEAEGTTSSLDATCVRQIEYAGVLKGAANPDGARAFITFMSSESVQSQIPEQMYMYPERVGVELPQAWAQYAKLTDSPIDVDAQAAGEDRETLVTDWTALFEASAK